MQEINSCSCSNRYFRTDVCVSSQASAVETMYRGIISAASEADTKVNLVATGPLTNVALLLKVHPNVKEHLSKICTQAGKIVIHMQ